MIKYGKNSLELVAILLPLNMHSLSHRDLIIFTIVILAIGAESRSRGTSLNVSSSPWMKPCASWPPFVPRAVPFLALTLLLSHQCWPQCTFSSLHLASKMSIGWMTNASSYDMGDRWKAKLKAIEHSSILDALGLCAERRFIFCILVVSSNLAHTHVTLPH